MFGFLNWWRVIAVVVVLAAISGTIYAGYRYVSNLQEENALLAANNAVLEGNVAQLEQGISEQQETIAGLQADIELQTEIRNDVEEQFSIARRQVQALQDRLSAHELGYLAANRPGLVENIVNEATAEVARCFEIATGAPLTEEEIAATLPSEINSECPELANPNYQESQ